LKSPLASLFSKEKKEIILAEKSGFILNLSFCVLQLLFWLCCKYVGAVFFPPPLA
jgi:hypothetical protein